MQRYFKTYTDTYFVTCGIGFATLISSWESKGLSDEAIKPRTRCNNNNLAQN